jgi:hypothetical protein
VNVDDQEERLALLEAENSGHRARLAARRSSPLPTNGVVVTRKAPSRFRSIHDAFEASAAELGYRPREAS